MLSNGKVAGARSGLATTGPVIFRAAWSADESD
jgi:hypothetical protein